MHAHNTESCNMVAHISLDRQVDLVYNVTSSIHVMSKLVITNGQKFPTV